MKYFIPKINFYFLGLFLSLVVSTSFAEEGTRIKTFHNSIEKLDSDECDNVTDPGEIGYSQSNIGAFVPEPIVSLEPASGGTGPIEYVWIKRTPDVFVWSTISGETGEELSPGLVTETTIFRRCARNSGCTDFVGESNDITMTVDAHDPLEVDDFNDCSFDGGIIYDVQIEGMEESDDNCMTVSDTTDMINMFVEVWLQNIDCPGGDLPSSIDVDVDGTVYTLTGVVAEQTTPGGATEKIYRVEVPGASSEVCIVDADLCTVISTALYIERFSEESSSSSFKTFNRELYRNHTPWGDPDCVSDILMVGESLSERDIEIFVPVHEKDNTRTVEISITVRNDAGVTVATASESFTTQNAGESASLYEVVVEAVPGDGTQVEIEVCSPHGTGDSFGIGAVALTTEGGCVSCETFDITSFAITDVSCEDEASGSATVSTEGGTAPYTYVWSNGQTSATATDLEAGSYSVTVTDANGCEAIGTLEVAAPPCCNVTDSGEIGSDQENCGPFDPALIESLAPASGGIGPVEYQWIKSDTLTPPIEGEPYWEMIPGATGATYDPGFLTESTYFVRCSRNEGCESYPGESNIISIIVHPVPTLEIEGSDFDCFGGTEGTAEAMVSGGTAPFTYVWSNGQTAATATGLEAGTYTVTVTDANGCAVEGEVTIEGASEIVLSATVENVGCFGEATGTATVDVDGGLEPFSYDWSNGQTTATATELVAGTYTVIVTDANGCDAELEVSVEEPESALNTSAAAEPTNCFGEATGSAFVNATGGTEPYTYAWSDGQTTASASDLAAGTYTVTVTDANGCESTEEVTVEEPDGALSLTISEIVDVTCFGEATGTATVTVSGGTTPYSYEWSNGQTTPTATDLEVGTYTVTVRDKNGCESIEEVTIEQPEELSSSISGVITVACFGESTGSATANAAGGTAPYTYAWSDGQTTPTATDLAAGTYTVTVTDANGCESIAEVIIEQPDAALSSSISGVIAVACFGESTGSATANAAGGTAPYTYAWSDGQTTPTATDLAAGTYTVTITDENGCESIAEVTIEQPDAALSVSISTEDADCFGATGSATATVTGGTAPYTYAWSDGQTGSTATELIAGTYTVTITDANGCEMEQSVTVEATDGSVSVSISSVISVACFGESTGSATANAAGGTAPYMYAWSDGQTTPTATDLAAGTYTVTVTDANGCESIAEVTIEQPDAALSSSISGVIAVACFGESTGSATANAAGGTAPYTYAWSDGQTTPTATGLAAGTYTVTVTDANGCESISEVTIEQPDAALSVSTSTEDADCFGATGSATATVTGGTAPYTYSWSDGQTGSTASELIAGTYTVTITDANGCETEQSVTVEATDGSVSVSISSVISIACFGESTGSATANAAGGTAPYTYAWSDGQTTPTATGLAAGIYTVTVTDANGCESIAEVTIEQPDEALSSSISGVISVACFGESTGSATANAAGGTAPYTYAWSDGQTTPTATELAAGTYTVTVTDANGCESIAEVTIEQPDAALSSSISDVIAVACFGESTGSATANAAGGTAPYTYAWSDGQTTPTAIELTAGTYTVTVTDANGCESIAEVTIEQPDAALSSSISGVIAVACFGESTGSATANAAGGTAPYTYAWSDGQTTPTATELAAGTYTVTVTDANGCESIAEVTIEQPDAALSSSISDVIAVACFGESTGSATANAAGGTAPYTYEWSDGQTTPTAIELTAGTYTVTVTDANGCESIAEVTIEQPDAALSSSISGVISVACFGESTGSATANAAGGTAPYTYAWSDGQTTPTATELAAGTYTVTVTDANGCESIAEVTIEQPDAALSVSISTEDADCFGATGSATATVTGGTAPYTYAWSDGQTGSTASELIAGTYTVTITDANGCETEQSVTVEATDGSVSVSISSVISIACFGESTGSATANAAGGTAPYTYAWSDGQTTPTATDLAAGTYTVTITDANGCESIAEVTIEQPDAALSSSISGVIAVACFGESTGSATANAAGGTAPYTYAWSDGQTTPTATDLAAGTYTVTVTDANGCESIAEVTIEQPDAALSSSISGVIAVACFGESTGSATANAAGGTAPYTYAWSDGQTTPTATELAAGTYTVTVTDANGCESIAEVTIEQPDAALSSSISGVIAVACFGESTGSATANAAGGTAPYTYAWSDGQTTPTATDLAAGTYTVTITDANGCESIADVTIEQPDAALSSSISGVIAVACFGESTGSATANAAGGTAPYTYAWSDGQTTPTATDLAAGTYTVTITDANGCESIADVTIEQPDAALSSSISGVIAVACFGESTGSATANAAGGTAPYTYAWSDGQTTPTATELAAGTYTVTVTDANGCESIAEVTIEEPDAALEVSITPVSVLCFGDSTGSATATVSGGTAPYLYSWSTGGTTIEITDLVAGTYTLTVTDANGCTAEEEVIIEQPDDELSVLITTVIHVDCFGDCTGSATAVGIGGISGFGGTLYSYLWSTGDTSATVTGLCAGTYTVTVTDENGCTATAEVTIEQPDAPLELTIASADVLCFGEMSGSATVTATGGTAPYTYAWSDGQTGTTATGLSGGTYSVLVTDANGCESEIEITIEEPDAALDISITPVSVLCFGDSTGSATATVSGGTAPYLYSWSTGGTTIEITDLVAGTYTLTVTDAGGCTAEEEVIIEQPDDELSVLITTVIHVDCFGDCTGSATAVGIGGISGFGGTLYSYLWSTGDTSATVTGLCAGTYTVTVTDENGCTATAEVTIEQPDAPLELTIASTDVLCFGEMSGSATVTATGGTAPYTYAWSDGQTGTTATGLSGGTYSVLVTDANGCESEMEITIEEPDAVLDVSITPVFVLCFGDSTGSAEAMVTGGTVPYSYEWSTGATTAEITDLVAGTYTLTVTDANGCTAEEEVIIEQPDDELSVLITTVIHVDCFGDCTGSATAVGIGGISGFGGTLYSYLWSTGDTSATVTGLCAGTYTVTVTDENGCTATAEVTIEQPDAPVSVEVTTTSVGCFGEASGSATAVATGGTAPYTYAWSDGQTGETASGLEAGLYEVTVTDANGCELVIEVEVTEPDSALSLTVTADDILCHGETSGSATADVTGGTAPYTYLWSDGQTTPTAIDLAEGTYTVVITDANGCEVEEEFSISEPSEVLAIVTTVSGVSCFGEATGSATATAFGGTAPYTYEWSDGQTGSTATGLAAGSYVVMVTDANGCVSAKVVNITGPDAPLAATAEIGGVDCFGEGSGFAALDVTGGTAPYTYLWSDGQTGATASGLSGGTYTVVVTDDNGCELETEVTIPEPEAPIEYTVSTEDVTCFGGSDGSATIEIIGGTAPYIYEWSSGDDTETASDLTAGVYLVIVTDANGCEVEEGVIEVNQPDEIVIETSSESATCTGDADGSATAVATGGTPGYTYEWSDGQLGDTATDLDAGTYEVTVTDANGCTQEAEVVVEDGAEIEVDIYVYIGEVCDGFITLTPTGGTAPYTYAWDHGPTVNALTGLCEGVYTCTITDANGCTTEVEVPITFGFVPMIVGIVPNPVVNQGVISINTFEEMNIVVDVVNDRGQSVMENLYNGSTGEQGFVEVDFNTSTLARGMYFVTVRTERSVEVKKVIIQ